MNRFVEIRSLYPPVEPRRTGRLAVSGGHELYWEESGAADGLPVVAVHGGPGGGSSPEMRRFFDPKRYRIIIFDQRGCGRSTPHSELKENTTWDLVADMEALREHLGVKQWVVFGGSWGSTLALAYAATHRDRVHGLLLRGIFLLTKAELHWFYQNGASNLFPDSYDRYIAPIPEAERATSSMPSTSGSLAPMPKRVRLRRPHGRAGKVKRSPSRVPAAARPASTNPTSSMRSRASSATTSSTEASSRPMAGCSTRPRSSATCRA